MIVYCPACGWEAEGIRTSPFTRSLPCPTCGHLPMRARPDDAEPAFLDDEPPHDETEREAWERTRLDEEDA